MDAVAILPVEGISERLEGRLEGLEARYERLLREHGPALRRATAGYEFDPVRREDLFQDICLAIWQALPRFRGDSSERTFLFRIAHNRGLTHRARRRPAPTADLTEAEEVADPAATPEAAAHDGQRRARLRDAVRRLPLEPQQVLTMTLEGLTPRDIADVLGITENNVAVRLSRARRLLRDTLAAAGEIS
ncbi:MAG TPA: sigma-70 family RNA polymerase sigma factor [Thermoanaerobaculia bacterium]|jgi:RNA polymerase sigma-70 factor (ECF subfamily)|nr:sigma-70 family RNA polymerase sigma factor [Thermoanaerobaculia bacterium]